MRRSRAFSFNQLVGTTNEPFLAKHGIAEGIAALAIEVDGVRAQNAVALQASVLCRALELAPALAARSLGALRNAAA